MMKKILGILIMLILMLGLNNYDLQAQKKDKITRNKYNQITQIIKYDQKDNIKEIIQYTYHTNKNVKEKRVYTNYKNNVWTKRTINSYRSNKKISTKTILIQTNKKIRTSFKKYSYNKQGVLKSNKYGKASLLDYKYFNNNKVASRVTYEYTAKGKLKKKATKNYLYNKPKQMLSDKQIKNMEMELLDYINTNRKMEGLPNLITNNSALYKQTQLRAQDMIKYNYFHLNSPRLKDAYYQLKQANMIDETIWYVSANISNKINPREVIKEWLTKKEFYHNITFEHTHVSVAYVEHADKEGGFWVAIFMAKNGSPNS